LGEKKSSIHNCWNLQKFHCTPLPPKKEEIKKKNKEKQRNNNTGSNNLGLLMKIPE
jgi:hypothetical protein